MPKGLGSRTVLRPPVSLMRLGPRSAKWHAHTKPNNDRAGLLASVRAVITRADSTVERRAYYPQGLRLPRYGKQAKADSTRQDFTGRVLDGGTQLHYPGAPQEHFLAALRAPATTRRRSGGGRGRTRSCRAGRSSC
jgi:hypothetical protein